MLGVLSSADLLCLFAQQFMPHVVMLLCCYVAAMRLGLGIAASGGLDSKASHQALSGNQPTPLPGLAGTGPITSVIVATWRQVGRMRTCAFGVLALTLAFEFVNLHAPYFSGPGTARGALHLHQYQQRM